MMPQIAGMLKDISRESLVILYTPSIDRSFSVLIRQASHIIEFAPADDFIGTPWYRSSRSHRSSGTLPVRTADPGGIVVGSIEIR